MAQILESQPHMCEIWVAFPAPSCGLARSSHYEHLEVNQQMNISACISTIQINKYNF